MPTSIAPAAELDRETAARDKLELRLWLRLLTCTQIIERRVRSELRAQFQSTLPRFDLLAQLDMSDGELTMGDLSSLLMVTSGNITSLIDAMERDGLVERRRHPEDRRSTLIRMTEGGRAAFAEMAPQHEAWIARMMGGLSRAELRQLFELLRKLKTAARAGDEHLAAQGAPHDHD